MKKITLTGPNVRNDGSYADAGTTLEIGTKPDQIDADRAKDFVDGNRAIAESDPKAGGDK